MADMDPNAAPPTPDRQPAPPTVPQQTPDAESDHLDALFSKFDQAAQQHPSNDPNAPGAANAPAQQQPPNLLPDTGGDPNTALLRWALAVEADRQAQRDDRDGRAAINAIRGEIGADIYSDAMVGGWIENIARNDPAVQKAWETRYADPKAYHRAVEKLGRRFAKEHGQLPDRQATEDREMVSAAVRGAGLPPPAETEAAFAKKVSHMTNAEFEAWKRSVGG